MKVYLQHLVLPSLAPLALVALYFTPKATFGCANRGYLALGVVLLATIAAGATTVKSVSDRRRGSPRAGWWMITTLILLLPVILLLGPLG